MINRRLLLLWNMERLEEGVEEVGVNVDGRHLGGVVVGLGWVGFNFFLHCVKNIYICLFVCVSIYFFWLTQHNTDGHVEIGGRW